MDFILSQRYYAKPEGEDFTGKMFATNKYMIAAALPGAAIDVLMYSHTKGAVATLARMSKWFGPAMGMASLFTVGTYASCNLRGKDDYVNYVVGACGAAAVLGKTFRNPVHGFQAAVIFSFVALFKKASIEQGWTFFPSLEEFERKRVYGTLTTAKHDYTIMKDAPEKGWTVNPAEA